MFTSGLINLMQSQRAEHHPHHGMTDIRLEILVRAGAGDDCDAILLAQAHRLGRNAGHTGCQAWPGAQHAVHPDMFDAQLDALLDDFLAHLWVCQDENRLRLLGDGFQVRVAWIAVKCR